MFPDISMHSRHLTVLSMSTSLSPERLGKEPGLWVATLSHEIAYIVYLDWARRYLYDKSLRSDSSPVLPLGDAAAAGSWRDPANTDGMTSRFSQLLETSADADGLMLMVRAGYHPDFMLSLHHMLRALATEDA